MLEVYTTPEFDKSAQKTLSPEQCGRLPKVCVALGNGALRGKPLRIPWLWEIKMADKRLYYVSQLRIALFVRVSDKDEQRAAIAEIMRGKERWIAVIERIKRRA